MREGANSGGLRNYVEQNAILSRGGQPRQNNGISENIDTRRGSKISTDDARTEGQSKLDRSDNNQGDSFYPNSDITIAEKTKIYYIQKNKESCFVPVRGATITLRVEFIKTRLFHRIVKQKKILYLML